MPVLCLNECMGLYRHIFRRSGTGIILVYSNLTDVTNFQGKPQSAEVLNARGVRKRRFSTDITVYLGNGTR